MMNEKELAGLVERASGKCHDPLGERRCISLESVAGISEAEGTSTREVSIAALQNGILPLRYSRNAGTVGLEGQVALLESKVLVCGAGGIGGFAAELLARTGVGRIVLADPDAFEQSNLNRQDFSTERSLGMSKVDMIAGQLALINSDVDITPLNLAVDRESLLELLPGTDVVIDGLDNFEDRITLARACSDAGVTMVHGAIAGTSLQVTTIPPGDPDPAGFLPSGNGSGKSKGIELETGNPAATAAIAAAIEVQEAVKVVTGRGETLGGKLLYLDLEDWTLELVDLL
jgi:molybdopterin/thiamine biosynthesis adenylyltransferase